LDRKLAGTECRSECKRDEIEAYITILLGIESRFLRHPASSLIKTVPEEPHFFYDGIRTAEIILEGVAEANSKYLDEAASVLPFLHRRRPHTEVKKPIIQMNLNEYKRIKARKLGVAILKERVPYLRRNDGDASQLNPKLVNLRRGMNDIESFRLFCHSVTSKCTNEFVTTKIV
jgi:hypothetical protein